jgi:RNA polymerase sigma-70 factor, ECF subfamily
VTPDGADGTASGASGEAEPAGVSTAVVQGPTERGAHGPPAGSDANELPDWLTALSTPGPERDEALRRLHALMLRAARHQVRRMRPLLQGASVTVCEDIANGAADEALAVLLQKLSTFEGRSRFTTWAYKFAILQAATEVRRHAWIGREISLDDIDAWSPAGEPGPEHRAEAADLAMAVRRALDQALTPYQRKIAVALLVDQVPIDVLADRLGTTRGALYKTLHMARGRLRAHLVASGHLPPARTPTGRPATSSSPAPRPDGAGS